ncbi:lipocalin-like domain-containing protein [Ferrimonas gelatinilytica]|uniref:Lipocalin-like domain-containing protein n=1 Tax=Ferrimonas gelatinilytica TaxID=1255257 RepID=A0ABP9S1Z5_9GAMM
MGRDWVALSLRITLLMGALVILGCQPPTTPERQRGFSLGAERGEAVRPGRTLRFPEDHGPHPEQGIEWWYLTATLQGPGGEVHGVQWTLFRMLGPEPVQEGGWWQGQWYMAHLAWSPPASRGPHRAWERWGRGGLGGPDQAPAGVRAEPFIAWIDHWRLQSQGEAFLPLNLVASDEGFALALTLDDSPLVAHGVGGYSEKSGDGALASYYYSLPRLQVQGHLKGAEGWVPVSGKAWLDREWSSRFLDSRFSGWDWLSVQLDSDASLMLFCLRPERGQNPDLRHCAGSWISPEGEVTALLPEQILWQAVDWVRLDGAKYPVAWEVGVILGESEHHFSVATRSRDQRNQLSIPYWEGPVIVAGPEGSESLGVGFIEMTGYEVD